jgi:hypothetical protein
MKLLRSLPCLPLVAAACLLSSLAAGGCHASVGSRRGGGPGPGGGTGNGMAAFPLKVAADGRTLVDQKGTPFLFQGEAAWGLIAAATSAEAELYLENRRQKGFNAAIVRLLEHKFAVDPPRDADGDPPFSTPGDFSTPNEAYFAHVDSVLQMAADKGILVLLAPAYLGYQGGDEGWYVEMMATGPSKLRDYGRWLGTRYRGFPNILWVEAGDFDPPAPDLVRAVALGILDTDPGHLHTAHCGRLNSAADCFGGESWLSVNSSYTSHITYDKVLADYARTPFRPFFLLDAQYENENGSTASSLRAQAYWAILCGAQGQDFGNNPIWHFDADGLYPAPTSWQQALESQGSRDMTRVTALFAARRWRDLVPDQGHQVLTSGSGTDGQPDYVTAARTADGRLVMAYVPSTSTGTRAVTVDMSKLSGPASASWYNPTTGAYTAVAGSPFAPSGSHAFTTPGDNGTGTNDWALVLEVP